MSKYARIANFVGSLTLIFLCVNVTAQVRSQNAEHSLRFYGYGRGDVDRVKIPLDDLNRAVNVGNDFTIEFFVRAVPEENTSSACTTGEAGWINGNIIVDRDIFGPGDYGDYGISLFGEGGVIAFGVSRGESGDTLCGRTNIVDDQWHHIAVTRDSSTGSLALYVDGTLDGSATGPTGDVSYRVGRSATWPNDPFIVIGAEKHDYDPTTYLSYSGWIDELRISRIVRYTTDFAPPTEPFIPDEDTVGLYHFDEGSGDDILDFSGTDSHGKLRVGGTQLGPEWSLETPFTKSEGDETTVTPSGS